MDLYAVPYSFPAETCIPITVGHLPMPPPSQRRQGPVLSAQISVWASATGGPSPSHPPGPVPRAAVPHQPRPAPLAPFSTRPPSVLILRASDSD